MPSENELYERWREASPKERPDIEGRLVLEVQKHARKIVSIILQEGNPDLVQQIVVGAMRLDEFSGRSKFSTWVQGIARNQIKEELRSRTRRRRVFDENVKFPHLKEAPPRRGFVDQAQYTQLCKQATDLWLLSMLAVGYSFGFCKGELLDMRVNHIDLMSRTIRCGVVRRNRVSLDW